MNKTKTPATHWQVTHTRSQLKPILKSHNWYRFTREHPLKQLCNVPKMLCADLRPSLNWSSQEGISHFITATMTKAHSSYRSHPIKIVDPRQSTGAKFCNDSEDKEQAEAPKLIFPQCELKPGLITLHNVWSGLDSFNRVKNGWNFERRCLSFTKCYRKIFCGSVICKHQASYQFVKCKCNRGDEMLSVNYHR